MSYTLITGATGYLGKAFCELCAKRGDNLFLTARSLDKLNAFKQDLQSRFPSLSVVVFPCDLTSQTEREALFAFVQQETFSCLINVAGADIQKSFQAYDEQKLTFQIRACFEGAVSFTRFAIAHRAEELSIINVSSVSGLTPMPYFALYSASKAALTQFSVALREEVKGQNIKVTAILPGAIYTRPDVIAYIKTQGVWGKLAAKTPEFVAVESLKAVQKNKATYIPGAMNRIIQFVTRFVPQRIKMKYIARRWSQTTKDAF